jgi:hypothetical protein
MVGAQYDHHYQINTQLTIGCFTNPPTKSHEANRYSPVNLELSYLKIKMHEGINPYPIYLFVGLSKV